MWLYFFILFSFFLPLLHEDKKGFYFPKNISNLYIFFDEIGTLMWGLLMESWVNKFSHWVLNFSNTPSKGMNQENINS